MNYDIGLGISFSKNNKKKNGNAKIIFKIWRDSLGNAFHRTILGGLVFCVMYWKHGNKPISERSAYWGNVENKYKQLTNMKGTF